ncbi:pantoate--beta-alanine ligase [Endozoicomonas sp. OPT23]|uniref:pantoate--beta-alanine ligase n=1 Tax=Endozoicomonas sp. OPT23 TaxID=2072845 RepID=UPI00129B5988|nr:pantoate--beta-alanine ligase [Endozoicomonas sp. OPT23]MRI33048.1 pantoate--beta-alanine ligase [Endozoicomonas sp. OPT23]
MKTLHSIAEIQSVVAACKAEGKKVGFVPTMGNLHGGHLTLVEKAKELCDVVVVSIYVNPLQFGPNEDYDSYPRTMEQDQELLIAHGVDLLYTAQTTEIYPEGSEHHTHVSVEVLDGMHCGKSRPGFFTGIATVVTKLFNIVRPDVAVFGEKDFQQITIIRKMVKDMCMPVEIIGAAIAREETGLAKSSRNGYLTNEERTVIAPTLYQCLTSAREAILNGERDFDLLRRDAFAKMAQAGFKPDYFNICSTETLLTAAADDQSLVILAAGYLGKARLIDNITIEL